MPPLLTVKQVAERLTVSASTVYDLVSLGKLPCHRVGKGGGAIRCSELQVREYLESVAVGASTPRPPAPRPGRPPLKHLSLE